MLCWAQGLLTHQPLLPGARGWLGVRRNPQRRQEVAPPPLCLLRLRGGSKPLGRPPTSRASRRLLGFLLFPTGQGVGRGDLGPVGICPSQCLFQAVLNLHLSGLWPPLVHLPRLGRGALSWSWALPDPAQSWFLSSTLLLESLCHLLWLLPTPAPASTLGQGTQPLLPPTPTAAVPHVLTPGSPFRVEVPYIWASRCKAPIWRQNHFSGWAWLCY